jgi:PAS domain S-box-containing protein
MAGPFDPPSEPEIERLFRDPAFRESSERGSPAFVVSVADRAIEWANGAARRAFGPRLETLLTPLMSGAPISGPAPCLKRLLMPSGGGLTALSFLAKPVTLADGREGLVCALLGTPPGAAPEREPEPEPALEPVSSANATPEAARPEAPGSGAAPAVAATAQDVRDGLLRSHRNPTIRFLWQTDEAGLVTSLTPPLSEIVGAANAALVGRDLAEVVEALRLDPSGRLLSAMRIPETWSGIEVVWPIAGAAAAVPVDLGGFPVFDLERAFRGFRGFGVIHLDRIRAAEPVALPDASTPENAAMPAADGEMPAVQEEPAPAAALEPAAEQPVIVTAPNVVPLRPFATLAAGFGFRPPTPSDGPALAEERESAEIADRRLSESEHQAFDEIARQLSDESASSAPAAATPVQAVHPSDGAIAVLDRLPLGVLISRNEVPVYANRMLLELTGHTSLEHVRAAGGLARLFEETRTADTGAGATSLRTHTGDLLAVESKLQAISWEGEPASLLTLRRASEGAPLAEAKSLELELRHREREARELRGILDRASDGVAVLDADGRVLSLNHSAESLFGYQQNEVAGEPFTFLIAAESRRLVEDYLAKQKLGGVPGAGDGGRDVSGLTRQGGIIPIFLTLGRLGEGGQPSKLSAIMRDTTGSKRAEREAREAREEAERASAIKSDFLAKVSHEIRTPLNAIIGFAEVIMDERLGPIGTERYKDYLRDIHKSGTHVMSLVNDLLDLSKIEAGKMVLDIKAVDANAVITECVALMQPQANRERVIMRLALAPRLAHIAADERSLRQIVLNLLSNAVKYNEPGGQVIISTAMSDTGHALVRIKDTGIGMSDAEIALALEPFRQVATARTVSGTGLGLPLTKALIEANRATFAIRSRKNEGTLVEIGFPPARVLAESA